MTASDPSPASGTRAPRSDRLGRYLGISLVVLGVLAAFFFPVSRGAGTETTTVRWITAGALLLAGSLVRLAHGRWIVAVLASAALLAAALVTGATWLVVLVVLVLAQTAIHATTDWSFGQPRDHEEHEESATDVIESIATAFILALIVREFAFEAFKIPTGSMEPTIHGDGPSRKGDRLLAAKAPLYFAEPDRWSIMVFKYPLFRQTNYIKRLVGLPGEHLENRDGDIYVNGHCVAKPEEVQETLWEPLAPGPDHRWGAGGMASSFAPQGAAKWAYDNDDGVAGSAEAGRVGWIVHEAGRSDVRVSFDVDAKDLHDAAGAAGSILVRIDADAGGSVAGNLHGRRVELEATRDGMWLVESGAESVVKKPLAVKGLGAGVSRLSFAVADRVARIRLDGRLLARIPTGDVPNIEARGERVWIGVSGGTARISKVAIDGDLQYGTQSAGGGAGTWDIPQGCYFMLGDNTRSSRDSRLWEGSVFKLKDGRTFIADESVRLDDERSTQNINTTADGYEFHDSYGIHRRVRRDELAEPKKREPQPFVRREDLVGRAFLIFFPFPPFGEWRPRLLP